MSVITVGPRDFIRPPYRNCPHCGHQSFGIWIMGRNAYYRRCRECLYQGPSISLPDLNKKIIYLDQFAISNMMKASNPDTKAYHGGTLDPFYAELYQRLKRLTRMQLIVCPSSFTHTWESLTSPFFKALEQFYEMLSYGVKFYDAHTIRRFQLHAHARNWIHGMRDKPSEIDVQTVVTGHINDWPPDFRVRANLTYGSEIIDELVRWRNEVHQGLSEVFERWRTEKHKTFDDWFNEELVGYGEVTLNIFTDSKAKSFLSLLRDGVLLETPESVHAVQAVMEVFREAGIPEGQIWSKTREYFLSPELRHVPSIRISSMLYAALARKAAGGQKRPPNRGMANDVEALSAMLPFCDAMFVDKECHALLSEEPLRSELDYGTLLFSLNNKQDFLAHLKEIENKASEEFITALTELYGDQWIN
jgi:hypothetical protein